MKFTQQKTIVLVVVGLLSTTIGVFGKDICGPEGCGPRGCIAPRNVVRICNETDKYREYGSGTLIEESGQSLILTCAHLFREGSNQIHVGFPGGHSVEAKLLKQDQQWDLAVLSIPRPPQSISPRKIATDWPEVGDRVQSCGWGGNDMIYRCNSGRVLGYSDTVGTSGHETLKLTGYARNGDSGGPIFNQQGELVAVCWGTDGQTVRGTFCGRIRQFLAGIIRPLIPVNRRPPTPTPTQVQPTPTQPTQPLPTQVQPTSPVAGSLLNPLNSIPDLPTPTQNNPIPDNRLEGIEDVLTELVATNATTENPDLISLAVPAILAGLGWTGPPAIAAVMGLRVLSAVRRRRKKERADDPACEFHGTVPRDDEEAAQFLRLSQLEGRSPLHDALVGRVAFDELDKTIESQPDQPQADWARRLKRTLEDRFNDMAPVALAASSHT